MRRFALLLTLLVSPLATAAPRLFDHEPDTLHAFVGGGYLGSPGGSGASVLGGLRLGLGRHLALSFDLGYGSLSSIQDRWWLMPAIAFVVPTSRVRFDFGAGFGVGTATYFGTWANYAKDKPIGSAELVPTVRGHAVAAIKLTPGFELFGRIDVASQLLEGNAIGIRRGDGPTRNAETSWIALSVGGQFRLL
jgi:hypothetical protein